ncbi:helix-turn-helix domain-containing protein [Moraxella haemolytica]|uniref:XRE family transcriptional regulator n=1 Tax=Moraxella haemolytica TaxID=2904119 RepID=UPI002543B231|nr:LexA family transcriptional regulator [Moraxella sp. ZY171148]WII94979.1 helix-turn-helix domain-containing protein [Moraxella sp. ZY171148]
MELKDRLKAARKAAKLTQAEVAEKVADLTQSAYSQLESGKTKSTNAIFELANILQVNPKWLATGEGEMKTPQHHVDELVASMPNGITHDEVEPWREQLWVNFYDVSFCCGDGGGYPEFEPLKKTLPFDQSFFKYRNLNSKYFKMIYAKGDSMAHYIQEGDAVGIDVSDIEPREGEVYALFWDGDLLIKRIYKEGGGVLRLSSDNPAYPAKIVNETNGESLVIIGRVVYRSG